MKLVVDLRANHLRRHFRSAGFPQAGGHIFLHSVEQVSRFLDHSSLAVTPVYLPQPERDRVTAHGKVAAAMGVYSHLSGLSSESLPPQLESFNGHLLVSEDQVG